MAVVCVEEKREAMRELIAQWERAMGEFNSAIALEMPELEEFEE